MCYLLNVYRVVLDSCVVVSAFRSRNGASYKLLSMVANRALVPLATPALFFEYEAVLKRPEQLQFSGLSIAAVDSALAALASAIEPVEVRFAWRPHLPDTDDEMVFDAAINGRAEALITHNIADFAEAAKRFKLPLLTPGQALQGINS